MSKIFVTGDVHRTEIDKFINFANNHKDLTKEDYLIVAGDFGAIWDANEDSQILNLYNDFPWTTLWVDGNHENFDLLEQYDSEEWHGGLVQRNNKSVIHLMRGQVYTIDNVTLFTMGGAASIDKAYRVEGKSWWKQEMPSNEELDIALQNLKNHNMTVDYVITHCCGNICKNRIDHMFMAHHDLLNDWFDYLEYDEKLNFKKWFFGHYHVDREVDERHRCLYDNILQIK